jgi:hypothetical protein
MGYTSWSVTIVTVTKIESSEKQKTYCKTVGFCERHRFKIEPTN